MNEKYPKANPDYGVRLTGDELAAHQQRYQQSQAGGSATSEYGPQGVQGQHASSEYGPQGGEQPGYQAPGYAQQPGYQQPGYQQPFGGPQLHPDMAKEPKRPKTVSLAFWSIIAAGIAYLITQLIMLSLPNRGMSDADMQMLNDMIGPMMAELPVDSISAYLNSPLMAASMIAQAVIFLVAYILVALGIRHGWRSMRIIGTIFAVFSLLNFTFVSPLATVFSVASVILGIVGIVYAWLPASTEYFRRKAWQKVAKRAYPDVPAR